jgi:hypothetical protein
MECR